MNYTVPPSSSPIETYRADLRRTSRRALRTIDDEQAIEIASIIEAAHISDFRPLLYVIPFHLFKTGLRSFPVGQRAHPMSAEFTNGGATSRLL